MKKPTPHSTLKQIFVLTAAGLLASSAAFALPITPTYTTFGSLPAATFGGSGIPNDRVAVTTIGGVTLGLTATQRYSNPPVGDDGAGNYSAMAGGDVLNSIPAYARWNFGFYAENKTTSDYFVHLLWDLNPGAGTDESSLSTGPSSLLAGATVQDSWNLGMGFLGGGFNPNVAGEYSFALILRNSAGAELGRSAINVNVASVPDVGSSGMLSLIGLGSVLIFAWMQRRQKATN